jgi:ribonuclease-3
LIGWHWISRPDVAAPEQRLQEMLGYQFSNPSLLGRALTHASAVAEGAGTESFERLEFLGDAVLELAISDYLYAEYPELSEGEMTKTRASVVQETALAELAGRVELADAIVLGKGEAEGGGREKNSILSDALEAVLGAVYLDGGFERVREVIVRRWAPFIEDRVVAPGGKDYKTRLHEILASRGLTPDYSFRETGPDHAKLFQAEILIDGKPAGRGSGTSKKRAQQEAARRALGSIE